MSTRRYATRQPREVRREQLLDATLELIARDGWAALRVNRAAEEAGIAKSVVYAIFGSLEELQRAAMAREQERAFGLSARALAVARAADDPVAAVGGALVVFLEGVAAEPKTWKLVLVAADDTPPSVAAAIRDGRERWRLEMEELARRFLGDAEPDVELVAHVVRGNAEYLAKLIIEDPERFTPQRIAALGARVAAGFM